MQTASPREVASVPVMRPTSSHSYAPHVVSITFFVATVIALFLPWGRDPTRIGLVSILETISESEYAASKVLAALCLIVPVAGLALSFLRTRGTAVFRAVLAALPSLFFAFGLFMSVGLTGSWPAPVGIWVSFLGYLGALITNLMLASPRTWPGPPSASTGPPGTTGGGSR